jgi:hypothetical protein
MLDVAESQMMSVGGSHHLNPLFDVSAHHESFQVGTKPFCAN